MEKENHVANYNEETEQYEVEIKAPENTGKYTTKIVLTDLIEKEEETIAEIEILAVAVETEIKKILSELNVPVSHLKYDGKETTYITWTIISEFPSFSSDDEIRYSQAVVDIDIYSKSNYLNLKRSIKNKMKEYGWMWKEDSAEMYEEDTKLYHRTCTFSKEREV